MKKTLAAIVAAGMFFGCAAQQALPTKQQATSSNEQQQIRASYEAKYFADSVYDHIKNCPKHDKDFRGTFYEEFSPEIKAQLFQESTPKLGRIEIILTKLKKQPVRAGDKAIEIDGDKIAFCDDNLDGKLDRYYEIFLKPTEPGKIPLYEPIKPTQWHQDEYTNALRHIHEIISKKH